MAIDILMPKLGMTMEEGILVEWLKSEKDMVEKGDLLFVIETEKVSFEVESTGDGFLLILLDSGENIPVGTVVGYLAESEAEYRHLKAPDLQTEASEEPAAIVMDHEKVADASNEDMPTIPIATSEKVRATPAARFLARKAGINIGSICGTGIKGRIERTDVQGAIGDGDVQADKKNPKVRATPGARKLAQQRSIDIQMVRGSGPNERITRKDVLAAEKDQLKSNVEPEPIKDETLLLAGGKRLLREEAMTTIRSTISRRMMESLVHSAQMTAFTEWDLTEFMMLRKKLNIDANGKAYKVSITGFMVLVLGQVLKEFPIFNASIHENIVKYWDDVNIGVAVAVDNALVVPVVRAVQEKSLAEIQIGLAELIGRARNKKLLPDDMAGGTFTLSNVGSYGSDWETVILNPPEVGLLGIGRILEKPVVLDGEIVIRQIMSVSLTFDHRLIDGATAGDFRARMKTLVETPGLMIACMKNGI